MPQQSPDSSDLNLSLIHISHDARGNVATKTEDVGLPGRDRRVTVYSYPQDKTGGTYPEMVSSGMTGIPEMCIRDRSRTS